MKTVSIPLAIVMISILGFFLIIAQVSERGQLKYSAEEMHRKVLVENYELDSIKFGKLTNPLIIDIRDRETYFMNNPQGTVNIPLAGLLDQENLEQFKADRAKVLLAHDPVATNETWMILTQMGYEGIYIIDPVILK